MNEQDLVKDVVSSIHFVTENTPVDSVEDEDYDLSPSKPLTKHGQTKPSFHIKNYSPKVFTFLRLMAGISYDEYLV